MNPWTTSFEQYRQEVLGETKKKSEKESKDRWQDDDGDNKWYEKSDVDGKISDREKKEKKKNVKENKDCCKKCGSYEHTTKECVVKEGIEDIIARLEKKRISKGGNPDESPLGKKTGRAMKAKQDEVRKKKVKKESVEVSHIDGSTTEIIDVVKAPAMVAAPKLYNWREDFIWEGPATAKDPKLDVKETGVKNKIEINPEVKTEEKKKLTKTSPLTDRVLNWSKTKKNEEVIAEGPSDVSDARTKAQYKGPGAPGLDAHNERIRKHKERRGKKKNVDEAIGLGTAGAIAGSVALAGMGLNAIRNMQKNKKKMETGGSFRKGSALDNIQKKNDMLKQLQNNSHEPEGEVIDERLGGKGYKPRKDSAGRRVSGDWENSDRGGGHKSKKRAGGEVEKKSPTYLAYVKNKKKAQVGEAKKKKDDTYLEPNWEKRKENNEKARKDLQKGPQMKNPHLEGVKYYSGQDRDPKTGIPKGLKGTGSGSRKEKPLTGVDYEKIQASYEPRFSVFDEAADRKMSRATDQQLADAHKKFSGMDQSSPANSHMTKRVQREINRRKKAAKSAQGTSPVKEEVGVSSSASMTNARKEAELQRKEALAKKKKGVKEHHQKDSNGKVVEHGDGTPSSVDESVYDNVKRVLDRGTKFVEKNPVGKALGNLVKPFKSTDGGSNRTSATAASQKAKGLRVAEGIVTELNRYEKETGKSSGSMNMPKGKETKKGGTKDPVMRAVRTSIRKETGKPAGQTKTRKKGEKTADMKGPSAKLQKGISKLKSKRELDAKAKKAGYKNTQDYIEVQARYPD